MAPVQPGARPVGTVSERPIVRTVPVVFDRGRLIVVPRTLQDRRRSVQLGLLVVLAAAAAIVFLARMPAGAVPAPSPLPTQPSAVTPSSSAPAAPTAIASASAPPAASASPALSPEPSASPVRPRTYRVRSGDTLAAIAARFKTTVAVLVRLNKLSNPRSIRVGQVLKLP